MEKNSKNNKRTRMFILDSRVHFARQDGQDGKNWKENRTTKVTKRRKYGMNET